MERAMQSQISKISDNVSDIQKTLGLLRSKIEDLEAEMSGLREQVLRSSEDRGMLLGTSIHQTLSSVSKPMLADDKRAWENGMRVISSMRQNSLIRTPGGPKSTPQLSPSQSNENSIAGNVSNKGKDTATPPPRLEALEHMSWLIDPNCGCDGSALLAHSRNVRMEATTISVLKQWLSGTTTSSLLWLSGPFELRQDTVQKRAGLFVVADALKLKLPLISHFCDKPQVNYHRYKLSLEKAGLMNLVYSLIHQLLQSNPNSKSMDKLAERVGQLGWNEGSWPTSLSLLSDLLHHAKCLPYCVIHGINDLESGTSDWCQDLLDVLLRQQQEHNSPFCLLFTTSGQSRALAFAIPPQYRYESTTPAPDVQKRGRYVDMDTE